MSDLGGIHSHVGTKGIYEEVTKDFKVVGLSGEDRTNPVERL